MPGRGAPPLLGGLQAEGSRVTVRFLPLTTRDPRRLLLDGEADIAIVSSSGTPPQADLTLPIYRWERVVLVPRAHSAARSIAMPARMSGDSTVLARSSAGP